MKTTVEYLKEAKAALNTESDYAFAKKLGLHPTTVSQYQLGKRVIDDYTAVKIAEALEVDPLEVIAAANLEREKDEKRQVLWRKVYDRCAAASLAAFMVFSGSYSDQAKASLQGLHAPKYRLCAIVCQGGKLFRVGSSSSMRL